MNIRNLIRSELDYMSNMKEKDGKNSQEKRDDSREMIYKLEELINILAKWKYIIGVVNKRKTMWFRYATWMAYVNTWSSHSFIHGVCFTSYRGGTCRSLLSSMYLSCMIDRFFEIDILFFFVLQIFARTLLLVTLCFFKI